ncbi:MAG: GNAT family N-acetyltransferase [Rhodothermia bacterium]|nr:GNAT family N-acetyltransferase [Rhodothermia bacterium]
MKFEGATESVEIREGLEGLTPARIATLYRRAPLVRSIYSAEQIWSMYEASTHVYAAWQNDHLVGIARVLSDGVLQSYLCDLAVEPDVQRSGVGKALLNRIVEACRGTELILRDSTLSASFYEHLGFKRVDNAWRMNIKG